MRLAFAGTPAFSVPTLAALYDWGAANNGIVAGVWTQPDRPAGRGRKLTASPVKALALEHNTPVYQPRSLRNAEAVAQMATLDLDLLVVVAYGLILPADVLATPRFGCVNVHASLLPRWRGAAPIQRAIAAGDRVTGVGIMAMDEGLDTGALWRNVPVPIHHNDTGATVHDRLSERGAQELVAALPDIFAGVSPVPQDPSLVTYASKLTKAEAALDFTRGAKTLADQVRAFVPWPVAQTTLAGSQLRVWEAVALERAQHVPHSAAPGTVLSVDDGITVACGCGVLRLDRVQPSGKRPMSAADFARDRIAAGVCLGIRPGADADHS